MCLADIRKVNKVNGDNAVMSDGRSVRLGSLKNVRKGDYLEVFANIAIAKKTKKDFDVTMRSRLEK